MPASESSSSESQKKKAKKKKKTEKKAAKGKRKSDRSRSRRRTRDAEDDGSPGCDATTVNEPAGFNFLAPTKAPSGLLDEAPKNSDDGFNFLKPTSRPSGLLDGRRSRSRDNEREPVDREETKSELEKDSSKGKDKGKGNGKGGADGEPEQPKEEPNFEASGLLAVESNSKNGIALNFTMPPDSQKADKKWRLYIFTKGTQEPKIIHVHRQLGYLFGKDRRVVDIPTDHQTCSKQHAVLHYRRSARGDVKPYIMDLDSKNGTFLNGDRIESSRYVELREKDMLKFAMSSREYVLLHGGSANHIKIDAKQLMSDSE